jgi:hypothetical protein
MTRDGEGAMIFRLSQKLSAKIKAGALAALPLDQKPFADWSSALFAAGRTQYVLLSHTPSLYSTVLYGRDVTDTDPFIECALSSIRESLHDEGQEFVYRRFIAPASGTVRFAKALDRSVTGSMNDLIKHATYWLAEGDLSPQDVGVRLNDILLSVLASNGSPYGKPRDAFRELVCGAGS